MCNWVCTCLNGPLPIIPPGNDRISPPKGTLEDDFPFPKVRYVSSLGSTMFTGHPHWKDDMNYFFLKRLHLFVLLLDHFAVFMSGYVYISVFSKS